MAIPAVNSVNTKNSSNKPKQKFNYVTITGYGALALGAASAIAGYKKKIKWNCPKSVSKIPIIYRCILEIVCINFINFCLNFRNNKCC